MKQERKYFNMIEMINNKENPLNGYTSSNASIELNNSPDREL